MSWVGMMAWYPSRAPRRHAVRLGRTRTPARGPARVPWWPAAHQQDQRSGSRMRRAQLSAQQRSGRRAAPAREVARGQRPAPGCAARAHLATARKAPHKRPAHEPRGHAGARRAQHLSGGRGCGSSHQGGPAAHARPTPPTACHSTSEP